MVASQELIIDEDLLFLVPAYNEEENIRQVVANVNARFPKAKVLVIDDGSTDKTYIEARKMNCTILKLPFNCGIGNALSCGVNFAQHIKAPFVITIDGDGQHDIAEVSRLIDKRRTSGTEIVIGERNFKNYKISSFQKVAIFCIRMVLKFRYKINIKDPSSGFRLMETERVSGIIHAVTSEFLDDTIGLITLAKESGLTIGTVETKMLYREKGKSLHGNLSRVKRTLSIIVRMVVGRKI